MVVYRRIVSISNIETKNECLQLYRDIQVLEKSLNAFLMNRIVPIILLCVPGLEVVGMYVCIQYHEVIPMPGFLVFPIIYFDATLFTVMVFTLASWVYNKSSRVLIKLGSGLNNIPSSSSQRKLMKRELRCCSVMQIKFGSNFVDAGTPLVIQNFCLNQTLSLLLIKSGYYH